MAITVPDVSGDDDAQQAPVAPAANGGGAPADSGGAAPAGGGQPVVQPAFLPDRAPLLDIDALVGPSPYHGLATIEEREHAKLMATLDAVQGIDPDEHAQGLTIGRLLRLPSQEIGHFAAKYGDPYFYESFRRDLRAMQQNRPRLTEWLMNVDNAAVAQDDLGTLERLHDSLYGRSWLGEMTEAGKDGFITLQSAYYHNGAALGLLSLEEAAQGAADANRRLLESHMGRSIAVQRYFRDVGQAEGLGVLVEALSDPSGLAVLVAENLGFSFPSLVLGAAGAKAGAAAGSAYGAATMLPQGVPIGATVGGIVGAATGVFTGGMFVETGAWINQAIGEATDPVTGQGFDVTDPEALLRAYRDPDLMARIHGEAARKGFGTAGFDAFSVVVGGGLAARAARAGRAVGGGGVGLGRRIARGAGRLGLESVEEGVGEAAGQYLARGEVDIDEVYLEAVASLGQSGGEMFITRLAAKGLRPVADTVQKAAQARQDHEAVTRAGEAFDRSKLAQRAMPLAKELVDKVAEDNELQTLRWDRDAWDEYWLASGTSPGQAMSRMVPATGAKRYAESHLSGQVEVPLGDFLEATRESPHRDGLLAIARKRADGLTLGEADEGLETMGQEFEASVAEVTRLFQEERALGEEGQRLDEQIAAAGEGLDSAELAAARQRRAEIDERMQQLAAEREEARSEGQRVFEAAAAELEAAGRGKGESRLLSVLHTVLLETAAAKAAQVKQGTKLADLERRFPTQFVAGKAPGPTEAPVAPVAFTPNPEWQAVPEGSILSPGLDIRMNLETGVNEARLPAEEAAQDAESTAEDAAEVGPSEAAPQGRPAAGDVASARAAEPTVRPAALPEIGPPDEEPVEQVDEFAPEVPPRRAEPLPPAEPPPVVTFKKARIVPTREGIKAIPVEEKPPAAPAPEPPAEPAPVAVRQAGRAPAEEAPGLDIEVEAAGPLQRAAQGAVRLADALDLRLVGRADAPALTWRELQKMAADAFEGSQAEGAFSAQDLANATEFWINRRVARWEGSTDDVRKWIDTVRSWSLAIPTQTRRTDDKVAFQQFSTPSEYAAVLAWAADVTTDDTVLEPSAGTGNIAAHALRASATVVANEIDPVRAMLLRELGIATVFREDAEQLDNILPADVQADVVLMNPPFSAAGQRNVARDLMVGARHVEQALRRLRPGGRLVAIAGGGVSRTDKDQAAGMAFTAATFRGWWDRLGTQYTVRANVGVSGKVYSRMGTSFPTRVLVIDNAGPTVDASGNPARPADVAVSSSVETLDELFSALEEVRDARSEVDRGGERLREDAPRGAGRGAGERAADPDAAGRGSGPQPRGPAEPGTGAGVRGGDRAAAPSGEGEPAGGARQPRPAGDRPGRVEPGGGRAGAPAPPARQDAGSEGGRPAEPDAPRAAAPVESPAPDEPGSVALIEAATAGPTADDEAGTFETYRPAVTAKGAVPHATPLVQSAAMASVSFPPITYQPRLDSQAMAGISDAQFETVALAGQAHAQLLPDGTTRRGFFIGDGTGVGKGRQIAAIIRDNFAQGRKKAVWISVNKKLFEDALRDWHDVGGDKRQLLDLGKLKSRDSITESDGIVFATYATLSSGATFLPSGEKQAQKNRAARMDQLTAWLPPDFDGVIAFDESHSMGNLVALGGARGSRDPSQVALAGAYLRRTFPQARVLDVSATGATEVSNLAYADRLGLWGEGRPFASAIEFVSKIANGGLAAMEMVARDLKQLGLYTARSLSMKGVKYERMEHALTPEQAYIYEQLAEAWQLVLNNIERALKTTDASPRARANAMSAFWATNQRFFNQVLTSMQMPTMLAAVKRDLAAGHAVVMQITNHYAAALERAIEKRADTGDDEAQDLDISPRDDLIDMVLKAFPVEQYEEFVTEDGKKGKRLVTDSQGNPVLNRQAVAARDELILNLQDLRVPLGPVDMVMQELGAENVAEVTGRSQRVIFKDGQQVVERRAAAAANRAAIRDFQNDKKQVLIFSQAGGTGASYHADLRAENQRLRRHYVVQPGWIADRAIQGFGRTHRTNQAQPPEYILVSTDIPGHKRFVSSIARRIEQLGALTKGQRSAGASVFSESDNLEGPYGGPAVRSLIRDVADNRVEGLSRSDLQTELGLNVLDPETGKLVEGKLPEVTQFLNRMLSATPQRQVIWFEAFHARMDALIEDAIARGELDTGMQELKAKEVRLDSDTLVRTDPETGAETRLLGLTAINDRPRVDFARARRLHGDEAFFVNKRSGRLWATGKKRSRTSSGGNVELVRTMFGPGGRGQDVEEWQLGTYSQTWEQLTDMVEAERLWTERYESTPATVEEKVSLLTGMLLPIWDRLPDKGQVYRVTLPGGQTRAIGREVPAEEVERTLERLHVGKPRIEMGAAEVGRAVLGGKQVTLSNRWTLRPVSAAGETRIEVEGPTGFNKAMLEDAGVFIETHGGKRRWFVPTGAKMQGALDAILKGQDILSVGAPRTLYQTTLAGDSPLDPDAGKKRAAFDARMLEEWKAQLPALKQARDDAMRAVRVATEEGVTAAEAARRATALDYAAQQVQRVEGWIADAETRLFQPGGKTEPPVRRGATTFGQPDKHGRRAFRVEFYGDADRSTFFHEMGHVWLEIMGDLAADPVLGEAFRDDYAEILAFLGVKDRSQITEVHHETWADAFMQYISTGEAPSARLRGPFAAFATWLTRLLKRLAGTEIKLSKDIRGVMDRMLATDEEIAVAQYETGVQPLPEQLLAALDEEDRKAYLRATAEADELARGELSSQVLAAEARRVAADDKLEEFRRKAARKVDDLPESRAVAVMSTGKMPDGSDPPDGLTPGKLKASEVRETLSGEPDPDTGERKVLAPRMLERLEGVGVLAEDGVPIDEAAEAWGFGSGDEMVRRMGLAADRESLIETMARARLQEEFPELLGTRQIRTLRRRAVANEARVKQLELEHKALARWRRAAYQRIPTVAEVKAQVAAYLAGQRVTALQPHAFLSAAKREGTRSAQRWSVGEYDEAAEAKGRERWNLEAFRQSTAIVERGEKQRAWLAKASNPKGSIAKTLNKAGWTYFPQAQALLARFNFTKMSQPAVERLKGLREWLEGQHEEARKEGDYREIGIPARLLDQAFRKHWRDLTAGELADVYDGVHALYERARTKDQLLTERKHRTLQEIRDEIVPRVRASRKGKTALRGDVLPGDVKTFRERSLGVLDDYFAGGMKAGYYARMMDGEQDGGPMATHVVGRLNEAVDRGFLRLVDVQRAYMQMRKDHYSKAERRLMHKKRAIAGVSISREAVLSLANHWGNPEGRQRVLTVLTEERVMALLATLDERDWRFVRARWAFLEQFWPEIEEHFARTTGVRPVKVEHLTWTQQTADGKTVELQGGYMPLAYSDTRPQQTEGDEWAQETYRGRSLHKWTRTGFRKERVQNVDRPLRLDDGVVLRHLSDVVHALSVREAIIDVRRILGDKKVHQAIEETYGAPAIRKLNQWVDDVAAGTQAHREGIEKVLAYMRYGAVIARLGFRVVSALKQLYGLRATLVRMKPGERKWFLKGVSSWLFRGPRNIIDTPKWVMQASPFMRGRLLGTLQRELNEMRTGVPGEFRNLAVDFSFWMLTRAQFAVDLISWLAQYEKTMSEAPTGSTPDDWRAEAVRRADQAVKDTQGGGQAVDLSFWERGTPLLRILTTFFTDAGIKFNLTRLAAHRTEFKNPLEVARFLGDLTILYFTTPVVVALATLALDPDEDEDEIIERMIRMGIAEAADMVPILRETSGPIQGYPYHGPAGLLAVQSAIATGAQIKQGEIDAALWRNMNLLGGAVFQYPAAALNEGIEAFDQVLGGNVPTALLGFRDRR